MPRATNAPASRTRRKRILKKAKGYRGRRSKLFRYAKDAIMKAQYWAYRDRKTRKRTFRYLWIQRLNAAARATTRRSVFQLNAQRSTSPVHVPMSHPLEQLRDEPMPEIGSATAEQAR